MHIEARLADHRQILEPGRNCWRIDPVRRATFLIDADAFFTAVRAAIARARHSIFILSWDIDSRLSLARHHVGDGFPAAVGDLLNAVVAERRGLQAYVLNWDFAMVYALEREWFPVYKLDWRTHRRLHFRLDANHPLGACHHQKVVVVDDAVAFVGGLDLTKARWDTPDHRAHDPERRDVDGKAYGPFHDVQMMVDGDCAAALGELARERWLRATGQRAITRANRTRNDPWPPQVTPDLRDSEVAIARTDPPYEERQGVQEIRTLLLDSIAAAEHVIYLENQYFTSNAVGEALASRLAEPDGPEVVLITRIRESGWLEETTMGVLRARLHRRLRQADKNGRYRAYYPAVPGLADDFVNVHSKLFIIDDALACVGSANLSNRSMGLDTECNLAIEARDDRDRGAIAGLRDKLLGEHLGVEPGQVGKRVAATGSLLRAIEELRGGERTLVAFDPEVSAEVDSWVPPGAIIDPERPIDPDRFVSQLVSREDAAAVLSRSMFFVPAVFVAMFALAAMWRWTPLSDWLSVATLTAAADGLRSSPAAPIVVVGAYLIAGLLIMPITVLVTATVAVFGPLIGTLYALMGGVASAALTYILGQHFGRNAVRRLAGRRLNRLSRRLAHRGVAAVVAVRVLPVAPFTVINVVAGASHIGLRDFLVGTAVGMLPGIIVIALIVERIGAAMRGGDPITVGTLAAIVAIVGVGAFLLRHRLRRDRVRAAATRH